MLIQKGHPLFIYACIDIAGWHKLQYLQLAQDITLKDAYVYKNIFVCIYIYNIFTFFCACSIVQESL